MKNFFKKLFGGLKVASVPIEVITTMINPTLGGLVTSMLNGILKAEATLGAGNGAAKAEQVLGGVATFAPLVISAIEAATGRDIVDDAAFEKGVTNLNSALVEILNAAGALPKPAVVVVK